ncbi:MAG: succinate dehydrogenase flavoprotein subunit [Legionellales bacterium]|nr:MAG: succinate dehydrogenase flavoprotein subunit [Legionellales bacterium]
MQITERCFDVVIIGAGGAGLRTALQLSRAGKKVAVISKVFPTRSHTVSAQGGITAALGNVDADDWKWHAYDTVKGSDYLGDQDAIEYMCKAGPEVVYELEHMGLPFSRLPNGKIYQRPFGGQSKNFGTGGQATRTAAAADRTGHALLHTLYQQSLLYDATFFNEWYTLDLVKDNQGNFAGAMALEIATGKLLFIKGLAVVLATGGAGRVYQETTNALINTGDGLGMALRAGCTVQDMEMWQFHPTGVYGAGVLISEGTRGEGGYLLNKNGERFMERYAPTAKDLASRDVVARAIAIEIKEGRGCGTNGDYVQLKLDHLGAALIKKRLPGIRELAMTFAGTDPIKTPIPVVPTCHYMMGGIPTNKYGQVIDTPNLYAVGECACVSVHGANRLGGNSLLDLVVFGRSAGMHLVDRLNNGIDSAMVSDAAINKATARYQHWQHSKDNNNSESVPQLKRELGAIMQQHFGVFRTGDVMAQGVHKLETLQHRIDNAGLGDYSSIFNTAQIEALELDNLMQVALATAKCAHARTESRGAHTRNDFPERDDANWIKHSLYAADGSVSYRAVNMKPEILEPFAPQKRVY